MRILKLLLVALFPWRIRKFIYQRVFGFKIGKGCYIGRSIIDTLDLDMAEGSRIGHLTIIRNIESLKLGKNARIGTFNWIFGYRLSPPKHFLESPNRKSILEMGDDSAITVRHIIDCTDAITVGSMTTIAGHRSQFLTHSIDLRQNRQSCAPIAIGSYCFLGTGVIVLKGCDIPDYTIVSAGSVVTRKLANGAGIYMGNPAQKVKEVDLDYGYFKREKGVVS